MAKGHFNWVVDFVSRELIVDFTYPYWFESSVVYFKLHNKIAWNYIIRPFRWRVYGSILTLLWISMIVYAFFNASKDIIRPEIYQQNSMLDIVYALLRQSKVSLVSLVPFVSKLPHFLHLWWNKVLLDKCHMNWDEHLQVVLLSLSILIYTECS